MYNDEIVSHIYSIKIGDWSGDGHFKTATYTICSPWSKDVILTAYKAAVAKTGIDLEKLWSEYEEDLITPDIVKLLDAVEFDYTEFAYEDYKHFYHATPEMLLELFMHLVRTEISAFTWNHVEAEPLLGEYGCPSIGYGLFVG